jgi:FMN phosphatase YigB (HAD superfamily)
MSHHNNTATEKGRDTIAIPTPEETGLKVLAFDQGGIYIGVDYDATIKAFAALGATNADELYTQAEQTPIIDQFERGQCSKETFYKYLRNTLKCPTATHLLSDKDLHDAWNAILTGVIPGVLEFIQSLRARGYITVVVSNTDAIHQEGVEQQLMECRNRDNGNSSAYQLFAHEAFDEHYLSFRFGYNKPYVDIFHAVISDLQAKFPAISIAPQEILFIDDSAKHITGRHEREGAINADWRGLFVPSNAPATTFSTTIIAELKRLANHATPATTADKE